MQLLGVLILAVAVAAGSAASLEGAEDRMKELILAVTEFARAQAAQQDPAYQNGSRTESFGSGDITGSFVLSNGSLSGLSKFVVDSVRTDPEKLAAHVRVRIPEMKLSVHCSIKGEAEVFGHKISGSGQLNVTVFNATVHMLYISLVETKTMGLKVKDAIVHPDIQDMSVEIDGLTVEGTSISQFEKSAVLSLFHDLSTAISLEMIYDMQLPQIINRDINGRSFDEVIQWLKNHKNDPINSFDTLSLF